MATTPISPGPGRTAQNEKPKLTRMPPTRLALVLGDVVLGRAPGAALVAPPLRRRRRRRAAAAAATAAAAAVPAQPRKGRLHRLHQEFLLDRLAARPLREGDAQQDLAHQLRRRRLDRVDEGLLL
ncbi:uncharacterized protein BKCO1_4000202 [Diplodia corticola]|uniref:Uncharacterized protein n=1 Tax=Diplodia corticola TaxID=236234 RepID=A0A1J9RDT3_9PEZI|nr:uncharacterized protein BKCO1_4000202 [Diplodia corticola]OJD38696.1 hypothetical protein BKCO1_4000202 [Diplodia corticola]